MTAREQRRRRRELRAMRRRVAGMIVLLSILAGLVLYAASHTWTGIEKGTDPAETDPLPLATVTTVEAAPPVTLAPVAEPETVSRYDGIEISDEDVYTLACLAYHEARGEPFEGQVAVIEVVLNRCLSDYFPGYGRGGRISEVRRRMAVLPRSISLHSGADGNAVRWPSMPHSRRRSLSSLSIRCTFPRGPYNDSIVAVIGNHYFCSIF